MFRTLTLILALIAAPGCAEESDDGDGGGMVQIDPGPVGGVEDSGDVDTCGPADLCARSIGECDAQLTQESCEDWYAAPDSCADMDGYLACNCDCYTEDTCDNYFTCGELCFEDYCQ